MSAVNWKPVHRRGAEIAEATQRKEMKSVTEKKRKDKIR
jgi:hypothetical protein